MRIHRLHLRNFRGITEREVHLPTSGVVVLQGENEVGKTSMIEAIDLLLDKPDSSKAREVREVKPVNRDVGPQVEAELSCGQYHFTYAKQWLRETRTELAVHAPRALNLTGADAHAEVRRILDETLDTALYQALRVLQAGELTSAALGESAALSAALDQAAGTTGHDSDGDALLEAVNAEYATYFTATGRETGAYAAAHRSLASAEETFTAADEQLQQLQHDVDSHARLTAELTELTDGLQRARRQLTEHEQSWQRLAGLRDRVDRARETVRTRRREHALLAEAAERRSSQDRALAAKVTAWEELTRQLNTAREQLHDARAARQAASADATAAKAEEQRCQDAVDAAAQAADHLQDVAALERARATIAAIEKAQATIEECEAALSDARLDADLLAAIDEADTDLAVSRARHEAAAARVQLSALRDLGLSLDGAEHPLSAGEELDLPVTEPVRLELDGTLSLSISPARSSADSNTALADAQQRLADLLRTAGVGDRRAAHRAFETAQRTRADLDRARERLTEELGDRTASELRADQARLDARLRGADFGAAEGTVPGVSGSDEDGSDGTESDGTGSDPSRPAAAPSGKTTPATSEAAQRAKDAAALAHADARERSVAAETRRDTLAERAATLELNCTLLEGKASMAEADINDQRLALADEREATPDQELEAAADRAASLLAEATEDLAAAEAELDASPVEQIEAARNNAVALTERLGTECHQVEESLRRLSVSLEMRGQDGLQGDYDAALTSRDTARSELQRLDRRARACRLLHETLHRARDAARSRYVRPFRDQVVTLGRIVYGTDFDVDVDDDLSIRSRTLAGITVPFDQLSAGAREQLAIITRLACAAVVDPEQGVPVIIDDALGYSDPERLAAMNTMIGSLAADAQVILLTCTPERYRGIGSASVIRLERSLPATG